MKLQLLLENLLATYARATSGDLQENRAWPWGASGGYLRPDVRP
ncbi:hypothetical protein [Stutzerimonas kirkiae]|nr:hypothetical protein [Stutzerimonas kirkiae]